MKILLATIWSLPHLGGVWRYMVQLKSKLEEHGHEVDLMGPNDQSRCIYIVNEDRRISTDELLEPVKQYLTPLSCPNFYIHPLIEYIETKMCSFELGGAFLGLEKYDLIHTQDVISTACISRIKPIGTAHIATLHGSVAHEIFKQIDEEFQTHPYSHMARSYIRQLEYTGAASADFTITANQWLKNILTAEFNVPSHQIRVLHYGYDTDRFLNEVHASSGNAVPPGKKVIFNAGRLVDIKGVHHLISALSELKKHRTDWICWIAGIGEDEGKLRVQAAGLGLVDDVVFLGERSDIPKLMEQADIFVLPSKIDNQPLSLIEAQISGLPSVVNNAGGIPEMVQHQVTGLVYSKEAELTGYLYSLIADDAYRTYLGRNARNFAMEHWPLEKGTQNVLQVYYEALGKYKDTADRRVSRQQARSYFETQLELSEHIHFGSSYGSLFSVPESYIPLYVKKGTWDLIRNSLAEGYSLPNPWLFNI